MATDAPSHGAVLPEIPSDLKDLDGETRKEAADKLLGQLVHKIYETAVMRPLFNIEGLDERRTAVGMSQVIWKFGLIPFRTTISMILDDWENQTPPGTPCITTSDEFFEETARHANIWKQMEEYNKKLDEELGLKSYKHFIGDEKTFLQVKAMVEKKKAEFSSEATTDEHRKVL
ncbi:hypothetical protein PHLCEN_2v2270 [Hermanssonia centrifuga]|uniref:Uncharacterized protein n=1 Tax=Hermanssonia centrifuga TaxID=98765 RepID=A0A2R6RPI9_9APHY|nr:hypothetical protein PHLCEN_2v2270 [Hermanssonia centrifuga]